MPAEGICRTCVHIYCLERDRGVACTDYKRGTHEISKGLEWNDGDRLGRTHGRKHGEETGEDHPGGLLPGKDV